MPMGEPFRLGLEEARPWQGRMSQRISGQPDCRFLSAGWIRSPSCPQQGRHDLRRILSFHRCLIPPEGMSLQNCPHRLFLQVSCPCPRFRPEGISCRLWESHLPANRTCRGSPSGSGSTCCSVGQSFRTNWSCRHMTCPSFRHTGEFPPSI